MLPPNSKRRTGTACGRTAATPTKPFAARPGVLITSEEDKEEDEKLEFHLRQVSDDPEEEDLFFAIPTTKESEGEGTPYLLSRSEDDVFYFWTVNHDAVEAGVEKGVLKGKITQPDDKGSHVKLDAVESNYRQLIKPAYWNWLQPTCIYRSAE